MLRLNPSPVLNADAPVCVVNRRKNWTDKQESLICIMAGDRYYITEQNDVHFVTFTVVEWVDVFTRGVYKSIIIVNSLNYCIREKGLECLYGTHEQSSTLSSLATVPARLSDTIRGCVARGLVGFLRPKDKNIQKQCLQQMS